jgi:hypothetical protein
LNIYNNENYYFFYSKINTDLKKISISGSSKIASYFDFSKKKKQSTKKMPQYTEIQSVLSRIVEYIDVEIVSCHVFAFDEPFDCFFD